MSIAINPDHLEICLEGLIEHPEKLERDRRRFDYPAAPASISPATPSTGGSSDRTLPPNNYLQRLELVSYHGASRPSQQFKSQVEEEFYRELYPDDGDDRRETIKRHWVQQGIWDDDWEVGAGPPSPSHWQHELGSELEEATMDTPSRPFYQFMYQLEVQRRRLIDTAESSSSLLDKPSINSRAYNEVQTQWMISGYWNTDWGTLPGMRWNHEGPLEAYVKRKMGYHYVDPDGYELGASYRFRGHHGESESESEVNSIAQKIESGFQPNAAVPAVTPVNNSPAGQSAAGLPEQSTQINVNEDKKKAGKGMPTQKLYSGQSQRRKASAKSTPPQPRRSARLQEKRLRRASNNHV